MDIKKAFEKYSRNNYFSRADSDHILELHLGLDDKGRKAIELREKFKPRKVTGTAAIEVNQYTKDEYNTIRFSLIDEDVTGLFYLFCDDLIEQTREVDSKAKGYDAIVNRFYQWKKMFVSPKAGVLAEISIMGLIGEILFLKGPLAERIGLEQALKSWSGQDLTHKDFSYDQTWSEIKTISSGSDSITINSLEQLESDYEGELVVYKLEKMSSNYEGVTLNKLIVETRSLFKYEDDQNEFISKVTKQGYEYNDYYDDFVYTVKGCRRFMVNESFPKITRREIDAAINKATYSLAISGISEFEIL